MKILFTTSPTSFQNPGGGEIQLVETKKHLENEGHEVDIFSPKHTNIDEYDLLHVFGISQENISKVEYADSKGLPVFLSTIYWDQEAYENQVSWRIKNNLRHTLRSGLMSIGVHLFDHQKMMNKCDCLLPNSDIEGDVLKRKFDLNTAVRKIPNGVSKNFEECPEEGNLDLSFENYDLFVGRLDRRKNLKKLIQAYSEMDRNLVIVGPEMEKFSDYSDECKELAKKNIVFYGKVPHESEELKLLYHKAQKFVLPSMCETPGLAALEAALAGCEIAITERGSTKEYFEDYVNYIDPSNKDSIIKAVKDDNRDGLKQHILENYTWDRVAERTESAYTEFL